jgi:5-methylcytosine-specific restriction endonuclease McrA
MDVWLPGATDVLPSARDDVGDRPTEEAAMSNDGRLSGRRLQARNQYIYLRDGGHCTLCGIPVHMGNPRSPTRGHVDHIICVSHGGSDDITNLRLTCLKCNLRRGAPKHRASREW